MIMILILSINLKQIQIQIQHLLPIKGLNGPKISLKQLKIVLGLQMTEEEKDPSIGMKTLHSFIHIQFFQRGVSRLWGQIHTPTRRLAMIQDGRKPWIMSLICYKTTRLGIFSPYLMREIQFSVNGSTRPSYKLMEPIPSTRLDQWQRGTYKFMGWNTMRNSFLLQEWIP